MKLLTVAILAGGLATRLRPITEKIPKSLVEVAGKPFICHQLDYLRDQGVERVVLCIGHKGNMIRELVGDGSRWGIEVLYSHDGPLLRGTGGAIRKALTLLGDQFFILYGDSYLPIDFKEIQKSFLNSGKLGLMTIFKNENLWDKSNVIFTGTKIDLYDKNQQMEDMHHIDYGLGILKAEIFFQEYEPEACFDLSEIYHALSINSELAAFEVHDRFYEIGSRYGISQAEQYLLIQGQK
jgi:MurNAc alpha-1-phosphate uridylyltransferase